MSGVYPSARAVDDRGKPITALHPRDLRAAADGPDPHRAALARHLRNAIKAESQRTTISGLLIGTVLVAAWIGVMAFVSLTRLPWSPAAVRLLIFIGGLVMIPACLRVLARIRVARQLAATAVAEGLCGSCAYGLRDIPAEGDGRIVCPECGAAWDEQRITRPYWLAGKRLRAEGGKDDAAGWLRRALTLTPPPSSLLTPDHRGRFVSVVDSRLVLVPRERKETLGRERCRKARRSLRRIGRILRILIAIFPLTLSIFLLLGAISSINHREYTDAALLLVPGVVFVLATAAVILGSGFCGPKRIVRAMSRIGLCPSCARPLDGLKPEQDGCVACPDCGGSWRAPAGTGATPAPAPTMA